MAFLILEIFVCGIFVCFILHRKVHDFIFFHVGNGQVVFDFEREPALLDFLPLGLEADTDGILYSLNYYNGSIAKIDPR